MLEPLDSMEIYGDYFNREYHTCSWSPEECKRPCKAPQPKIPECNLKGNFKRDVFFLSLSLPPCIPQVVPGNVQHPRQESRH